MTNNRTSGARGRQALMRTVMVAMFVAIGVVISPILRIEGLCPTAHLMNITVAAFMGPWYALLVACLTGIIRMLIMNIPPLALTGAIFGAMLSGLLYRGSHGKILAGVVGEVIGTGIIGAIISYPVMTLLWGRNNLTWFFYVPSFFLATLMGGTAAFVLLKALTYNGMLYNIQKSLGVQLYDAARKNK